jgi:general secretion pathway protein B
MSYILEALKKSQAERQLGAVPTIDTAPIYGSAGPAPLNKPLWLALGALALLLLLLLALLLWRAPHAPVLIPPAAPIGAVQAPQSEPAPELAKVPKVASKAAEAPRAAPELAKAPKVAPKAAEAAVPDKDGAALAKAPQPAPPVPPVPPVAATEARVLALRELPEPIQRQIPALAIGGYIYSKNPADRLLLVDKTLRREGEEVAPGLMLEKLQPAAAIFNYLGYRYRVPY